jgi:hypothetical protein
MYYKAILQEQNLVHVHKIHSVQANKLLPYYCIWRQIDGWRSAMPLLEAWWQGIFLGTYWFVAAPTGLGEQGGWWWKALPTGGGCISGPGKTTPDRGGGFISGPHRSWGRGPVHFWKTVAQSPGFLAVPSWTMVLVGDRGTPFRKSSAILPTISFYYSSPTFINK